MNKCARCEILTDNDFGEDSKLWVEVKGHKGYNKVKYARYLCDECASYMINALEKFIKVRQ